MVADVNVAEVIRRRQSDPRRRQPAATVYETVSLHAPEPRVTDAPEITTCIARRPGPTAEVFTGSFPIEGD